jgi:hypothetical protein
MPHLSRPIGIFAIACGLLANAPARAASPQTWVSGTGGDSGACSFAAPCKTFAFALSQTTAGGAINVLSSGNFGPVTITKSISIVAEGVEALINTAAGGAAVLVNGPGILVSLRGLTIELHGSDSSGISFRTGAALHVENCLIRRGNFGIDFVSSTPSAELFVSNTTVADNSVDGIVVRPTATTSSSSSKITLDRVNAKNNGSSGIAVHGTAPVSATISNSVAAGNTYVGIFVRATGGRSVRVTINRTEVVNNGGDSGGYGLYVEGGSTATSIGDSTVFGNGTGLFGANSGGISTFGTNKVYSNIIADAGPTNTIPMR